MNLIKIDFLFLDLYYFTRLFKGIVDFDFIRMIKLLIIIYIFPSTNSIILIFY